MVKFPPINPHMKFTAQCKGYTLSLHGKHYGPGEVEVASKEVKDILEAKVAQLDAHLYPENEQVDEVATPESANAEGEDESLSSASDSHEGASAPDTGPGTQEPESGGGQPKGFKLPR